MSYKKSPFEGVPKKFVNKSRFNRSHEWKAQIMPGKLIPCLMQECMPGDEWELETEYMFRFLSLYFPIMHKLTMRADTVYCPNRILWPEGTGDNVGWKKWITEQEEILPPTLNADMEFIPQIFNEMVLSYMGIPLIEVGVTKTEQIDDLCAFQLSAYLKWWDEYERNPQLEDERWFPLHDGNNTPEFNLAFGLVAPDDTERYLCFTSKWEKDYFTSALPTPQLGDAIQIPSLQTKWQHITDDSPAHIGDLIFDPTVDGGVTTDGSDHPIKLLNEKTIKDLRVAEVLQGFYERIMKVGTRYRDWIEGLFGDDPEPGVVDVPILIKSTFGRVQVSDVMQTTDMFQEFTDDHDPTTGNYRGQMNLYERPDGTIRYNCKEHGFLFQILQINPNTSYGQGIHRMWRRTVQTDYPMDIFSGIGDQEIYKEEVLYNPITAQLAKNRETFGYIPQGSEMRYQNNIHIGRLNLTDGVSMHLGRIWDIDTMDYDLEIEINAAFVGTSNDTVSNPDQPYGGLIRYVDVWKTLNVGGADEDSVNPSQGIIFAHIFHSLYVNRALPMYATPGKNI